jgi:hypothetical protein
MKTREEARLDFDYRSAQVKSAQEARDKLLTKGKPEPVPHTIRPAFNLASSLLDSPLAVACLLLASLQPKDAEKRVLAEKKLEESTALWQSTNASLVADLVFLHENRYPELCPVHRLHLMLRSVACNSTLDTAFWATFTLSSYRCSAPSPPASSRYAPAPLMRRRRFLTTLYVFCFSPCSQHVESLKVPAIPAQCAWNLTPNPSTDYKADPQMVEVNLNGKQPPPYSPAATAPGGPPAPAASASAAAARPPPVPSSRPPPPPQPKQYSSAQHAAAAAVLAAMPEPHQPRGAWRLCAQRLLFCFSFLAPLFRCCCSVGEFGGRQYQRQLCG